MTTTIVTFTDDFQGAAEDEANDSLTETENPGDNQFTFNDIDHATDSGIDSQMLRIATTGTTTAGATVQSLEIITFHDQYQDDVHDHDPGTEDDNTLTSQDAESDLDTRNAEETDIVNLSDTLDSTMTTPQVDGSIVAVTTHSGYSEADDVDDNDVYEDDETAHTDPSAPDGVERADHITDDQQNRLTILGLNVDLGQNTLVTLPNGQGTIRFGNSDVFSLTSGSIAEYLFDDRHTDNADPAGDDDAETDDLTTSFDDTDTAGDSLNYDVTDPTTGVRTQVTAGDSETDNEHTGESDHEVLTVTPITGPPGNQTGGTTDTEQDSGDDSDSYNGTSSLNLSILGNITPNVTANLTQWVQDNFNGGSHDDWSDDSPSPGNDTGQINFGFDNHDLFTGGGSAIITNVSSTSDGLGNSTSINETTTETDTLTGSADEEDDGGTEIWAYFNGQLTNDDESDTETADGNYRFGENVTTRANDMTVAVDPATGLTTTDTFIDNGSTNNSTLTENGGGTDIRSQSLTRPGTDTVSESDALGENDMISDDVKEIITLVGTDGQGDRINLTRTSTVQGNETDQESSQDTLAANGTDTNLVTREVSVPNLTVSDQLVGSVASTDLATGIQTVVNYNDNVSDTANLTDTKNDTILDAPGVPETDTSSGLESGQVAHSWNTSETTWQYDAGGNPIGTPKTDADIGNDSVSDSNGTFTESLTDVSTSGQNAPIFSGASSFTVPIGSTPTGISVTASSPAGNTVTYSLAGAAGVTINSSTGLVTFNSPITTCEDFSVTATDSTTGDSATENIHIDAVDASLLSSCFAPGTPIRVPDGWKPIEDIKAGDYVLARDDHRPESPVVFQRVEFAFQAQGVLFELVLQGRSILTTPEHPFHVHGGDWISAKDLGPGMLLSSLDGPPVTVESIRPTQSIVRVHNMRVAESHTYFVGEEGWGWSVWAHNDCGPGNNASTPAEQLGAATGRAFANLPLSEGLQMHLDDNNPMQYMDGQGLFIVLQPDGSVRTVPGPKPLAERATELRNDNNRRAVFNEIDQSFPDVPESLVNRLEGVSSTFFAAADILAAVPLAIAPEPSSKVGAVMLVGLALDNGSTGLYKIWTGEDGTTRLNAVTVEAAVAAGVDRNVAEYIGDGTELAVNLGAPLAVSRLTHFRPKSLIDSPDVSSPKVIWDNGWRTADGKFARPQGTARAGASAEADVWNAIEGKPGWQIIRGEVSVRDAAGQLRKYDGAAVSPTGRVIGLEVKSGSATLRPEQRSFDSALNSSGLETLPTVGQHKGMRIRRALEIRRS